MPTALIGLAVAAKSKPRQQSENKKAPDASLTRYKNSNSAKLRIRREIARGTPGHCKLSALRSPILVCSGPIKCAHQITAPQFPQSRSEHRAGRQCKQNAKETKQLAKSK